MENGINEQEQIAIVGMACRFPGADNLNKFWQNLVAGIESISTFSDEELLEAQVDADLLKSPHYVKSRGIVNNADHFDASFFGYSPGEAELLDPQQRIFLECSWHALEDAGCDPEKSKARIGVYGGTGTTWHLNNLYSNSEVLKNASGVSIVISNDKDYVTTRVSYKLNLKGPSVNLQCACSTSMAAVVMGMYSLLNFQCDMVLAGGATIEIPEKRGYIYQPGGMESPEGKCRTFDKDAKGTVFSRGCGVVALKRLSDAMKDGDNIYAVIKGGAINNDGNLKVGFTAPSVDGQIEVALEALEMAGVSADTISYVEAHGTATLIGDPIEVTSLTRVFSHFTTKKQYCAIGSVKTNIGHTDVASGVAGLIKTALALKYKKIPASLNFNEPNPKIDFVNSPFFVNTKLRDWTSNTTPLRALINSFGVGGTNVCAVLEEPPILNAHIPTGIERVFVVSAKTDTALNTATTNVMQYLENNTQASLENIAYTLHEGRRHFAYRRFITGSSSHEIIESIKNRKWADHQCTLQNLPLVFMFPGQGNQYANMALGLYEAEKKFRDTIDHCAELLLPHLNTDIRKIIFTNVGNQKEALEKLEQTAITQPALFIIEYAMAKLWMSWGLQPTAMIGHSVGEYTAACLSGIFSLQDALKIVAGRGRVIQQLPGGAMLAILSGEEEVLNLLPSTLELAAVNGPNLCVASGPNEYIKEFEKLLKEKRVYCKYLATSHAFHSYMIEPALPEFRKMFANIQLNEPSIPICSTVTGKWLTAEEATNPEYWITHARKPVLFSYAAKTVIDKGSVTFLECGPGKSLASAVKSQFPEPIISSAISSIRSSQEQLSDTQQLAKTIGELWLSGHNLDWKKYYDSYRPVKVSMPGYPFEREKFAIQPLKSSHVKDLNLSKKNSDIGQWFYIPSWKRTPSIAMLATQIKRKTNTPEDCVLIFEDELGLASEIENLVANDYILVIRISKGVAFDRQRSNHFIINPSMPEHYTKLMEMLLNELLRPSVIFHLWNYNTCDEELTSANAEIVENIAFFSPLFTLQSLIKLKLVQEANIIFVANGVYDITGEPVTSPGKALLAGPARVMGKEYPSSNSRFVEVSLAQNEKDRKRLAKNLVFEIKYKSKEPIVAFRGEHRWTEEFIQTEIPTTADATENSIQFKDGGIYLITGGQGGLGLFFAQFIADTTKGATIILTSRNSLPEKSTWRNVIASESEGELTQKLNAIIIMEEKGANIVTVGIDAADYKGLLALVKKTEKEVGHITGVLHCAGLVGGGIVSLANRDAATAVLKPKLMGTLCLHEVFKTREPEFFILFSSITSILGESGRMDYCSANSFMDAFAHYRNQCGLYNAKTLALNWLQWAQIGMAARWEKSSSALRVSKEGGNGKMLEKIIEDDESIVYNVLIDPTKDWIMSTHLLMNTPTLVGTAFINLLYSCAKELANDSTPVLSNVSFISPLMIEPEQGRKIRLFMKKKDSSYSYSFKSQLLEKNDHNDLWQEHFKGSLLLEPNVDQHSQDISSIKVRMTLQEIKESNLVYTNETNSFLQLGTRWDCLKNVYAGENEWLAFLSLKDEFSSEVSVFPVHPALADVAMFASFAVKNYVDNTSYLPFAYKGVTLYAPLTPAVYSFSVLNPSTDNDSISFDIIIMDSEGKELMKVKEYTLKKITTQGKTSKKAGIKSPERYSNSRDILPTEGIEAFKRIANNFLFSQMIICTSDLKALIEESSVLKEKENKEKRKSTATLYKRPHMSTAYIEPENDIEKAIHEIWSSLFGIDKIGIDDEFIELGGNSLLAVQMLSNVSGTFNVEIPVESFYGKPTIRGIGQVIVDVLVSMIGQEEIDEILSEIEN